MNDAGLQVQEIAFTAGGKPIVRGVSLTVHPGETLAVIGPSGCGKTTLLRLIAGLEQPTAGAVSFDGESLAGVAAHRRGFGMMFQDFALFPHLDVSGNVAFGLRHSGLAKRERAARISELLDLVGLAGYERRTVGTLSGGERQRVALARSLAPNPRLLMLDEPLGSLDRGLRERLLVELKTILRRVRIPAVYVTHDQYEAFAIADTMAVMRAGLVVRGGAPQAVHADPGTEFVARFLGLENVIAGVREGTGAVVAAGSRWPVEPGAPGPVRLLLRGEGAAVAIGAGEGVLTGLLEARLFQGTAIRIRLRAGDDLLEFDLPAGESLPNEGQPIAIRVPRVQLLEPD